MTKPERAWRNTGKHASLATNKHDALDSTACTDVRILSCHCTETCSHVSRLHYQLRAKRSLENPRFPYNEDSNHYSTWKSSPPIHTQETEIFNSSDKLEAACSRSVSNLHQKCIEFKARIWHQLGTSSKTCVTISVRICQDMLQKVCQARLWLGRLRVRWVQHKVPLNCDYRSWKM